ncbi:MAG: redoxin domain-containing protein, partial [Planctomycetia bacterium]|nr:redoxin domain-containing protein [Planctomycetia bacterium]
MRVWLPAVLSAAVAFVASLPAAAGPGSPGTVLDGFALKDSAGAEHTLAGLEGRKAVVLVFVSTQCPISNRSLPELSAIARELGAQGAALLGVNPNHNEQGEIAGWAKERGVDFPVLCDGAHGLADRLGIETIPTAVVLDGKRVVRYRGRIDDDPMGGRPRKRELRDAVAAVLSGGEIAEPETAPRGCSVRREPPPKDGPVTWARDVAPILWSRCVSCHRPGQIGPFHLTDYEHASAFAKEIRAAVSARRMPPWKPTAGVAFLNERRLSDAEIETVVRW